MRAAEYVFVGALVHEHPWFVDLLQEHLDFYDGLLPHVFLADVERWAEASLAQDSDHARLQLSKVLEFLERSMQAGPETAELVSVSFLELLPRPGEPGSELRSLVGPVCRAQLTTIG
jgi:hypothetical protein